MSEPAVKRIILDTDPGVDDALALIYLRAQPCLRLEAITTVFGNADIDTTTRNALYLRDRFAPGTPVYRGAEAPLSRPRGASPVHVHGHNGLGDIDLGDVAPSAPEAGSAAESIIALVRVYPGEITLLAIGPLTNLALALRAAPDIANLVDQVVVMGGAFGEGGRGGNVTPFAEANIHNDPEASAEVLAAAWPVTLVGLDVTGLCVLSTAAIRGLARDGGETGRFVETVSRDYVAAYGRFDGLDGCCLHDVAAAAYVQEPELFKTQTAGMSVTLKGERAGQTQWDLDGRAQTACLGVDVPLLVAHFLDAVRRL